MPYICCFGGGGFVFPQNWYHIDIFCFCLKNMFEDNVIYILFWWGWLRFFHQNWYDIDIVNVFCVSNLQGQNTKHISKGLKLCST